MRRAFPLHHSRHGAHVSFTAVLGVDVFQHRVSGQRSLVSSLPIKILDALGVSTSMTGECYSVLGSTDAIHR
jgi:hypothetical protein